MSGQSGEFPNYASHIRLSDASPTPMVDLSQPRPAISERKSNGYGEVNYFDGHKHYELEGGKVEVHELDGGQVLSIQETKRLPDLPPQNKDTDSKLDCA